MGIESEADKDLALEDEDAENVVGGSSLKKKTAAKHTTAAKHGTGPTPAAATGKIGPPTSAPGVGSPQTGSGFDPALGRDSDADS